MILTWNLPNKLFSISPVHPRFKTVSIDFTHHHRESGLFVCVSIQLERAQTHRVTTSLTIRPLLIPSSFSGLDLQVALMVTNTWLPSELKSSAHTAATKSIGFIWQALLLISALLILFGELWSMATERAQYLHQCTHWLQLVFAFLSLATAVLQFCFLSQAISCVSKVRGKKTPKTFLPLKTASTEESLVL